MCSLLIGWILIALGLVSGALIGLGFHAEAWLGGYGTWRRRLLRLGHIACFGMGFLNLALAWSLPQLGTGPALLWAAAGLAVAGVTMPVVCWLSAWRKPLRHAFPIPVISALFAVGCILIQGVSS
ncbi:MAG: hypothetical protein PF961_17160 [Planctomycetota bacterium]|jgi:hypothetical protein|nr:hypothetical protein [Planctomycetota bacterium]